MVEKILVFAGRLGQGAVIAGLALLVGSGCQSNASNPSTAPVPVASALEVTVEDADQPDPATPRPTYRDGYPNFAGSLSAASAQMTNEEAQALQQRLTTLSSARQAGVISEAEYQTRLTELRKLAAEHGPDAQAQIAN